jgi:hypothetical protein
MTLTNTTVETVSTVGNGINTDHAISFVYFDEAQIHVFIRDVSVDPNVDTEIFSPFFSIIGGVTVRLATATTASQKVVIRRQTDQTQTVDYQPSLGFPSVAHEAQMDKAIMIIQELSLSVDKKSGLDALLTHIQDLANPHQVTATQVGKDTAQWNASKIQGKTVDLTGLSANARLAYDAGSDTFKPTAAPNTPGNLTSSTAALSVTSGTGATAGPAVSLSIRTATDSVDGLLSPGDRVAFGAKENSSNKSTDGTLGANSDTLFPTQKAVKTYADGLNIGKEVTSNKSTDGTFASNSDTLYPSQKAAKTYVDTGLATKQATLGYTPQNQVYKDPDGTLGPNSDLYYPTQKAVKTYVDTGLSTKQNNLGYTAENTSNKSVDGTMADDSTTKYPSQSAVRTYVASAIGAIPAPDPVEITATTATTLDGMLKGASSVIAVATPNTDYLPPIGPIFQGYTEKNSALGEVSGNVELDVGAYNVYSLTRVGDIVFSLTGDPAPISFCITLFIGQTDLYTVTWPTGIFWRNGALPNLALSAGPINIVSLFSDGLGTIFGIDGGTWSVPA